jgi:hypothetical protein
MGASIDMAAQGPVSGLHARLSGVTASPLQKRIVPHQQLSTGPWGAYSPLATLQREFICYLLSAICYLIRA